MDAVWAHAQDLAQYALEQMRLVHDLEIYGPPVGCDFNGFRCKRSPWLAGCDDCVGRRRYHNVPLARLERSDGHGAGALPVVRRHQGQGCTGYRACDGERGRYDHKSCEGPYARGPNDRAGHVSCIPHEHAGGRSIYVHGA